MADGKQGWKRWQQAALGAGVLVFVLLFLAVGFRKPWIEPLPGVRTAMTRPFVRESDLGPDSAYRLMLEGTRIPAEVQAKEKAPIPVWSQDWTDALTKFKYHPWPTEPPRAEPGDDSSLSREAPWTREQCEDILRLVRLFGPQIAQLDLALAAPDPQMPTEDSWNAHLDYLSHVRHMAKWLVVSAHYRTGTGDFAGAFRDFERILGLANLVSRGGLFLNHSVGISCAAMAAEAAWVVASRERVPAPVLRDAALAFLAAADEVEPFVEAIRAEALCAGGSLKYVYGDLVGFFFSGHSGYPASPRKRAFLRYLFGLSPLVGSTPESTARNLDACFQHLVVLIEKPYWPANAAELGDFHSRLRMKNSVTFFFRTRDPLGQIIAAQFVPGAPGQAYLQAVRRDFILRGMALFLAVRAYETEHGEPPDTLEALVPDYLPRIPEDPFDGKPLRYLRRNVPGLPPEAWAVYSIGENFTDDGGTAHAVGTQRQRVGTPPRYIPNPDYVWPSVGYPAEKK